jgi:hypothetical protein
LLQNAVALVRQRAADIRRQLAAGVLISVSNADRSGPAAVVADGNGRAGVILPSELRRRRRRQRGNGADEDRRADFRQIAVVDIARGAGPSQTIRTRGADGDRFAARRGIAQQ